VEGFSSSKVNQQINFLNIENEGTQSIKVKCKKILDLPYAEWKKIIFSKGTLHYMKQNAMSEKPFTLNAHVRERLEMWEGC